MRYYFAPMEGITTYNFRQAYCRHYGGVEKYFTPFLSNRNMSGRERQEILPEHNAGMNTVPQILTNQTDIFLDIAKTAASYGYREVNLNLGCPSGTVVARKRGAGFLSVPGELERFLDEIFSRCPVPISVKTRIGLTEPAEWERLLALYHKFPLKELIIHPRLQREGYGGRVHIEAFQAASAVPGFPVCYNGDILSLDSGSLQYGSLGWLLAKQPDTDTVMLGRGLLRRPGMINGDDSLTTLRAFHDDILEGYRRIMSGDTNTLYKMKDLWTFLLPDGSGAGRPLKKVRKAQRLSDYEAAVDELFRFLENAGAS
ncbi:MAG: tRNA-dihydrouridine synthase family protein [Roseburia sp.]|nr:tRNA-dihydrouridine synthase family protein [Roseburia sp.]MCM1097936.1 tRNA-dihydrouridine synthase family protein [Ruminococcus flavefaciens]